MSKKNEITVDPTAVKEQVGQPSDSSELKESSVKCSEYQVVDGTPFATVNINDERAGKGVLILLAGMPASIKTFKTREEAIEYIQSKPWDLITGLVLNTIVKNNEQPFKITR